MQAHLLACPEGFSRAIEAANAKCESAESAGQFAAFCGAVFHSVAYGEIAPDLQEHVTSGLFASIQEATNALNMVSFVFRGVIACGVSSVREVEEALAQATDASPQLATTLALSVGKRHEGGSALDKSTSVGRLLRMEWKVGLTTCSSAAAALDAPHVTLVFHVTDGHGSARVTSVELTVAEFQKFKSSLFKAAEAMDTT